MSNHYNPGPPLRPEDEFCACQPPSGAEYAKAAGVGVLTVALGGAAWFGIVLATHKLWGFTTVVVGLVAGWAVNRSAGTHRSISLGIIGGAATVLATICGYALLWLPFVDGAAVDRQFSWYDLLMVSLGAFMAYRLAGPKPKANDGLK
ncbi:MAG TPA: hypothetical protein VD969_10510 [Symbiobacteriaceae bacterium]|nr:hypothetical protein [Symbiobacteriaceae bacterium]